ncbi:uncharacterized protein [Diabrotica undecimpunctata]|uniref:uncharacterized protein n=1 Tax=Diabrotica undecimpunctata TaxID=50387 RepID=UPI003B641A0A
MVPKEKFLAVDEQIIPTRARSQLKQYNPKKLCAEWYFGIELCSQSNIVPLGAPNLSMSSNVFVKLENLIPKHQHYKLFFDNWFTSIPLMIYLTKEGSLPLGAVRLNRVPGVVMPAEKEIQKRGRGHIVKKIANIDNVDVSVVSWFDNKIVTTM